MINVVAKDQRLLEINGGCSGYFQWDQTVLKPKDLIKKPQSMTGHKVLIIKEGYNQFCIIPKANIDNQDELFLVLALFHIDGEGIISHLSDAFYK